MGGAFRWSGTAIHARNDRDSGIRTRIRGMDSARRCPERDAGRFSATEPVPLFRPTGPDVAHRTQPGIQQPKNLGLRYIRLTESPPLAGHEYIKFYATWQRIFTWKHGYWPPWLWRGGAAVSLFSSDDDDGSDSSTEEPEQPTDNSVTYTGNEESELDYSYDPSTGQIRFEDASGEYELVDDGEFVDSQFEPVDPPAALVQVSGTDGQDDMIVTGNDFIVCDSDGVDLVETSGMESGIVIVNDGDTLEGPDGTDHNVTVLGRGDITMDGGDGDDVVYTRGGSVTGGDGDDYVSITGAGTVQGEDGNDTLVGNYNPLIDAPTEQYGIASHIGNGASQLDGDNGDDLIMFDSRDTVSGGAGADTLVGFVDPAFEEAMVSDFSPAEDVMTIWVNQDILHEVTLTTEQGDTLVMHEGVVLARIADQTGLSAGYYSNTDPFGARPGDPYAADSVVTDAQGNTIAANSVSFIIGGVPSVTT